MLNESITDNLFDYKFAKNLNRSQQSKLIILVLNFKILIFKEFYVVYLK
jgi:hypothetical protein